MPLLAVIVTEATIIIPFIAIIIYTKLIIGIIWLKTIKFQPELSLFYFRAVIDILLCLSISLKAVVYALTLTGILDFFTHSPMFAFYVVWVAHAIGSMRALLVLVIAVDRVFATYSPINFFKYRKLVPNFLIIAIVSSYLVIDEFVMFHLCGGGVRIPKGCTTLTCLVGACYETYWLAYERILYSLVILLTLIIVLKLFIWNMLQNPKKLQKPTRLALIDTVIVVIFDLFPPIIHSIFPMARQYIGSINGLLKTFGFGIESYLVSMNLRHQCKKKDKVMVLCAKIDPSG